MWGLHICYLIVAFKMMHLFNHLYECQNKTGRDKTFNIHMHGHLTPHLIYIFE